jgi:hypothetical protein
VLVNGCSSNLDQALVKAKDLAADGKDVAFAVVGSNGHVYPKTLIVREGTHKILWLAAAGDLNLGFPPGTLSVTCAGPLCFAPVPPALPGVTNYTGTITKGGTSAPLDPRLEVVP